MTNEKRFNEITRANTFNAAKKARKIKPFVKHVAGKVYEVTNRAKGSVYEVEFATFGKTKLAHCECVGFAKTGMCYHAVAAVGAHIQRMSEQTNVTNISDYKRKAA